jgi:hypothetical protein
LETAEAAANGNTQPTSQVLTLLQQKHFYAKDSLSKILPSVFSCL